MRLKLAQCLGLASLILLENYADFLAGAGKARMHVPFSLAPIAYANICDILLLAALLFAILFTLKRTRLYPFSRLVLAILIPLYFLGRVQALVPFGLPELFAPIFTVAWPSALLLLFLRYPLWYRRAMLFGSRLGASFGLFALFSIGQLLWVARWQPGPHQIQSAETLAAAASTTPHPPRTHPRILWLLFDELSYDQLFEHRAHDLALPNFDRLRAQSTLYTNTQPIGDRTVTIIPSLLFGQRVDDYRFRWNNTLDLHFAGQHGWHPATGPASIFGDAQRAGWRTGVVGWYNPYCTLYGASLNDCYWMNWDKIEGPMAQDKTLAHNIWIPLNEVERRAVAPARAAHFLCNYDTFQRLRTHLDLERHTLDLLQRDQDDFIYLHLAIPHSPNIYSRLSGTYTTRCDSSYLDNLALADIILGKILDTLQSSPRWASTAVIVQGDHSWRTPIWNALPAWTDEDDAAARDTFDPRPALLVHQPNQLAPATNSLPYSMLQVHTLLETLLHSNP